MSPANEPARHLMVVGGAEDKVGRARVLRRFLRLAGGKRARVAVLPTASSVPQEMVEVYEAVFSRLGAAEVIGIEPRSRAAAADDELTSRLDGVTGIYMTGGNQLKLAQVVAGTPLAEAIHAAYRRGTVIGGTSAGASVMSTHMISMGGEGVTPRQRASQLSAGFGLIGGVVVDQHFDQRARYGRLMSIVAQSPSLLGVGVDEDTAALITDERRLEVVGGGAVFVVDASMATSDAHEARVGAPLLLSGAIVHTLPTGSVFDLVERRLVAFTERHGDPQVRASRQDREEARLLAERIRSGALDLGPDMEDERDPGGTTTEVQEPPQVDVGAVIR